MNKIKILVLLLAASLVSGCILMTSATTVTLNEKPAQIAMSETGLINAPIELSVNKEILGLMDWATEPDGSKKVGPLQTKYGTFILYQESNLTLTNSKIWWDIYLNDEYIGKIDI